MYQQRSNVLIRIMGWTDPGRIHRWQTFLKTWRCWRLTECANALERVLAKSNASPLVNFLEGKDDALSVAPLGALS
jgi:hypothetical protein